MNSEINVAWAAGFYEGEGSIGCSGRSLNMTLSQVNREPLDKFLSVVQVGKIYGPYDLNRKSPIFTWKTSGSSSIEAFELLRPYLSERRLDQAETAFAKWNLRSQKPPRQDPSVRRRYQRDWARANRARNRLCVPE